MLARTRMVLGVLCLAAIAAVAVGCGPSVHNITVRSAASVTSAPDAATIVVIQPSTRYGSVNLLSATGELLGQINDRSATIVRVPPGPFRLYAIPERQASWGQRIEGTVDAGRVYFATIGMHWGGITFLALNPRSRDDRWAQRDQYLSSVPMVMMDPGQIPMAVHEIGNAQELIMRVDQNMDRLDPEHQAEHLVQASDGL